VRLRSGGLTAAVLAAALAASPATPAAPEGVALPLDEVELADDMREQERGLMFREELCPRCGMLFAYPRERPVAFWMRNTFLPLDMIFMDSAGVVVGLHERTVPMQERPLYTVPVPARYVLEVNAGFAAAHGVSVGAKVELEDLFLKVVDYRWP